MKVNTALKLRNLRFLCVSGRFPFIRLLRTDIDIRAGTDYLHNLIKDRSDQNTLTCIKAILVPRKKDASGTHRGFSPVVPDACRFFAPKIFHLSISVMPDTAVPYSE